MEPPFRDSVGGGPEERPSAVPVVLRWGPYEGQGQVFGGGIGGYARYNSQALRSPLAREVVLVPLQMSVPRHRNRWLARARLPLRWLADASTVIEAIARSRPDVLHITSLYRRSIFREAVAVWAARVFGVPVLFDIRGGSFEAFWRGGGWLSKRLTRYAIGNSAAVSVQGASLVPLIQNDFGRDACWLPNCFLERDLDRHPAAPLRPIGPDEALRLVFVGYLMATKGIDVLLEAARLASSSRPVRLTLIGAPSPDAEPLLRRYRSLQNDRFRLELTGRLELPSVLERLQHQHLFVFPSRHYGEGQSNAVTEAMAMGLPVICSRQGFLPDLVTPDCGVVLDHPLAPATLASVVLDIAGDWPSLACMGRRARRRIVTAFSDRVVMATTHRLYEQCAAGHDRRRRKETT